MTNGRNVMVIVEIGVENDEIKIVDKFVTSDSNRKELDCGGRMK